MSKFKPGDRVALRGVVTDRNNGTYKITMESTGEDRWEKEKYIYPLKKRGKMVAKVKTHIAETFGIGHVDVDWENEINLNDYIGKRVEVTVRLIGEEK